MKKVLAVHPLLLALFPILFVLAQNLDHIAPWQAWPSTVLVLGLTTGAWLVMSLILRDTARAAIPVSLFLVLFFSYGPARHLLPEGKAWNWLLLIVWLALFALGTYGALRARRNLQEITKILNAVALVLVAISLFNVGQKELRAGRAERSEAVIVGPDLAQTDPLPADQLPNIYYVILDGYGRADILRELYNYDNSDFLASLEQEGFYVAESSQANYAQTALSLASTLNLDYLDKVATHLGTESTARQPVGRMIRNSVLFQFLRDQGYQIVAFPSGYSGTDVTTADIYMGPRSPWNELELGLLLSTPLPWLMAGEGAVDLHGLHANRTLHIFDELADTTELPEPHFVFAHVVAPHPPFVFDKEGNRLDPGTAYTLGDGRFFYEQGHTPEDYLEGYTAQVAFVSERAETVLKDLSARSSRPAIIIVQADHGPGMLLDWEDVEQTYFRERLTILNAFLLPEGGEADLYEGITPVNTFRVILNRYFGTSLEMLPDKSFFSTWGRPYTFVDVTEKVRSGEPARLGD